jgi:hypothetical protein
VDDPTLNHALLEAFFGNFQLCADFKNLFVYPQKPLERCLPKVEVLPAWAHQSKTFYDYLPLVLPDLQGSEERVVFESELVRPTGAQ